MYNTTIARQNSQGKTQSLYEHIRNVSFISGSSSHFPDTSRLIAYLHDFGKLSNEFQNYITEGGRRGSVIHAWQGAFYVEELIKNNDANSSLLKEIIAFITTAHHNNIPDGVSPDGDSGFFDKFSNINDAKYSFDNIKSRIKAEDEKKLIRLFNSAKQEISSFIHEVGNNYKNRNSANFSIGLLIKYLYSCLVDADRLDAYLFENDDEFAFYETNWNYFIDIFEKNIKKFSDDTKINKIRNIISEKCKKAADKETGIYQLSVPTGGGKTLSSLRFAFHHCKRWRKKRVIYIIPYLSIIEQTAKSIREILELPLENEFLLEHHSNVIGSENEETTKLRALAAARWDKPIIITTIVQFMESVMSSRGSKLRKFANMADAVLIFDEIQSMPVKTIHCFNEVITFLSKTLKSTILLCSATQPTLESTQRANLLLSENPKLIDCADDFSGIKRVKVIGEPEKNIEEAAEFILEKANENGNCLVIVNTKKTALDIYKFLKEQKPAFPVLHLSTSMCPMHRLEVIDCMKEYLRNHRKVICVSTQLIEAGVDISFSCVIRAMAGLDSVAQAAGRCNRHGESLESKNVYVFPLKDESLDKLPDIKSGKDITIGIIQNQKADVDLLDEAILNDYYKKYFYNKNSQMDYPTNYNQSIYSMLSGNNHGRQNYFNKNGYPFTHFIAHAFQTSDISFNVIENNAKSIVVQYGNVSELIDRYHRQPLDVPTKEKIRIIKELQKHSVALYEWQMKILFEQRALSVLDNESGILILDYCFYSRDTGVVLNVVQENLIV